MQVNKPSTVHFVLLFIFSIGCDNPFASREAEAPETQQATNWIPPTKASDVLDNLLNAIKDQNLTNYMNSLTNTALNGRKYKFRPDKKALIRFPGVWDNWDLDTETTYIINVFQAVPDDSNLSMIFLGEGIETPLPDSTVIIRDYELYVPHIRTTGQFPRLIKGRAEFHLAINAEGFWAIFTWIDDSIEDNSSWSELKASFTQ